MHRLCPDILLEIFTFCLPTVAEAEKTFKYTSNREAPLLLCSVCSCWRSLVISTPHLWQTLCIHSSLFHCGSKTKSAIDDAGIRTWLDRSRTLPLSLSIRVAFTRGIPGYPSRDHRRILQGLSQETTRWGSFKLHSDDKKLTSLHLGALPMLHTFDISQSFIEGIPFTAAPCLKRLKLPSLHQSQFVSAVPWDQLIELTICKSQTVSISVEIIEHCPRLEFLSLKVEESREDTLLTTGPIIKHDTLRNLSLEMLQITNVILVDRLTLPTLTELSLQGEMSIDDANEARTPSQLVNFFDRSNCELQKFTLNIQGFGDDNLLKCLSCKSCQTLTDLMIYGYVSMSINKELITGLTYPDDGDYGDIPLCPKLRHLLFESCYCPDRGLIGKMIYSRCFGRPQDAQLESFTMNPRNISKQDLALLQLARSNAGLNIFALENRIRFTPYKNTHISQFLYDDNLNLNH